jgi:hypothetical protein
MERKEVRPFRIEVGNQFKGVEREILVYSSYANDYSIVRWPKEADENSMEFVIPTPKDYLLISLAPKHAEKEQPCWVELPLRANLEFLQDEKKDVCFDPSGERVRVNINRGPQTWQLKVTAPSADGCPDTYGDYKSVQAMKSAAKFQEDDEVPDDVKVGDDG